jgi:hypothetical protein
MVKIDSGPVEATDKFYDTPKEKWRLLLIAKRSFLGRRLEHDCRCLIEFCEEAELVYADLGFTSAEEMIREGYELDPSQIELAVAWLKHNQPGEAIGLDAVKVQVAEARTNPLKQHGEIGNGRSEECRGDNITSTRGTGTDYTLRRLARDAPDMLDKVESGELSVNQAAIQAGIRKKPTAFEIALKASKKLSRDEIQMLIKELQKHEPRNT